MHAWGGVCKVRAGLLLNIESTQMFHNQSIMMGACCCYWCRVVCMPCYGRFFHRLQPHSLLFPVSSWDGGWRRPSVSFLVLTDTFVIKAMLDWYTIVCCCFYDTFVLFCYTHFCFNCFVINAVVLCVFGDQCYRFVCAWNWNKKGWSCHAARQGGPALSSPQGLTVMLVS